MLSLRDKIRSPAEALLKLTLMERAPARPALCVCEAVPALYPLPPFLCARSRSMDALHRTRGSASRATRGDPRSIH